MSQVVFGDFSADALTALGSLAWTICLALLCLALAWIAANRLGRGISTLAGETIALIVLQRNDLPQSMPPAFIRSLTGWLANVMGRAPPTLLLFAEALPPISCARAARRASQSAFPEDPHVI